MLASLLLNLPRQRGGGDKKWLDRLEDKKERDRSLLSAKRDDEDLLTMIVAAAQEGLI